MPKLLCIMGLVVAGLLAVLFGADLAIQIPFGRASILMDAGMLVCALIFGYLSWSALREQK